MTKTLFNAIRLAEVFDEFLVDFVRNTVDDPARSMGLVSVNNLKSFVDAALVGYLNPLRSAIPKRLHWIDRALAQGEKAGESLNFHRSNLLSAKGLYLWLRGEGHSTPEMFKQAADALWQCVHQAFGNLATTQGLDDCMVLYFLGKDYEQAISVYEQLRPKPSWPIKGAPAPRDIGYWLCANAARSEVEPDQLHQAARRMLKSKLDTSWLGRGQSMRAATWLMAIHWYPSCTLTPVQTLLKAYDDMPLVQQPSFSTTTP
jgi:tetratricopeptide (TPR) repeat protein